MVRRCILSWVKNRFDWSISNITSGYFILGYCPRSLSRSISFWGELFLKKRKSVHIRSIKIAGQFYFYPELTASWPACHEVVIFWLIASWPCQRGHDLLIDCILCILCIFASSFFLINHLSPFFSLIILVLFLINHPSHFFCSPHSSNSFDVHAFFWCEFLFFAHHFPILRFSQNVFSKSTMDFMFLLALNSCL